MKRISAYLDRTYLDDNLTDTGKLGEDIFSLETLEPSPVEFLDTIYKSSVRRVSDARLIGTATAFHEKILQYYNQIEKEYNLSHRSIAMTIDNCYVFKSVIYRPADDGLDVFHETYRSNDRPWVEVLDFNNSHPEATRFFDGIQKPVIFLGSAGSQNYGHWIVDDLPRAKIIQNFSDSIVLIITRFGETIDRVKRDSIELLKPPGLDIDYQFIRADEVIHIDRLVYITPVSYHPFMKNYEAMEFVRSLGKRRSKSVNTGNNKIFVKRNKARYRKISNNDEIEDKLKEIGFTSIDPENLSFLEQVDLFSNSDVVVGIMCAAMTNTVFCDPGTTVFYLAPEDWEEPFYWDLACTMQQRYVAIYGERHYIATEPFLDDFKIDCRLLIQSISELIDLPFENSE